MKKVGFTHCAVVFLLLFVFSAVFFVGCGGKTEQKITYNLRAELTSNLLNCSLDYFESGLSGDCGETLCFCLQPNYLFSCEKLGESEKKEKASEDELPLKIIGGSTCEVFSNGNYALIKGQKTNGGVSAKINFTVEIPEGSGRLGISGEVINLAAFYPIKCVYDDEKNEWITFEPSKFGDPFFCDFADYEITLIVPSSFVLAGGTPKFLNIAGDRAEYVYSLKNYRSPAFCLSKNFNVISQKSGYRSINCYFVESFDNSSGLSDNVKNGDDAYKLYEKLTALAAKALSYFEKNYGEYAYDNYSLAFVPFYCGGMEYSAFSVINSDAEINELIKAVVHETAHQWLPLNAGVNEYSEAYFDEGFAEFSTYCFLKECGSDLADEILLNARRVVGANFSSFNDGKIKMDRSLNEFLSEYDYYACVYARGLILFCETQTVAGEKSFLRSIKTFFNRYAFKKVRVDDFLKTLSSEKAKKVFLSIVRGEGVLCLPK